MTGVFVGVLAVMPGRIGLPARPALPARSRLLDLLAQRCGAARRGAVMEVAQFFLRLFQLGLVVGLQLRAGAFGAVRLLQACEGVEVGHVLLLDSGSSHFAPLPRCCL
jgi:hypothetical protein